jgi:hypothetical protein
MMAIPSIGGPSGINPATVRRVGLMNRFWRQIQQLARSNDDLSMPDPLRNNTCFASTEAERLMVLTVELDTEEDVTDTFEQVERLVLATRHLPHLPGIARYDVLDQTSASSNE